MTKEVEKIVEDSELVTEIGKVEGYREIEEGLNSIYVLESGEEEYVLKVRTNHRNDLEWFRAEPVIYRGLEELDLPSPRVVYSDVSEQEFEAFFVMEKLEGVNPEGFKHDLDIEVVEKLVRDVGKLLGRIHEGFKVESYGMMEASEGRLKTEGSPEKWTWHIQGALEELEDLIDDGWEEELDLDLPSEEEVSEKLPERPEKVLLHIDNRLDNLLVEDGEITGFLDWSHPEAGHSEYDIVRAEYLLIDYDFDHLDQDEKQGLRDAIYEGYEKVRSIDTEGFEERRDLYRKITVIWLLAGFPNWKSTLNPEEQEEMREYLLDKARSVKMIE